MEPSQELRAARLRAGMSQSTLARAAGTSQAAVSQYERGTKVPAVDTLVRLLRATGVELVVGRPLAPVRRPTAVEIETAGRTLQSVLELAALLPTAHDPELRYPRLSAPTR